jgi:hypothetical protein
LADGNRTRQNKPSHFTIFAVDKNGKRRTTGKLFVLYFNYVNELLSLFSCTGGDLFDVHIEDPLFDQLKVEVVDKGDGTYDVFYQAKEPGVNEVAMVLRNRATPLCYDHIKDSPKGVNILRMQFCFVFVCLIVCWNLVISSPPVLTSSWNRSKVVHGERSRPAGRHPGHRSGRVHHPGT